MGGKEVRFKGGLLEKSLEVLEGCNGRRWRCGLDFAWAWTKTSSISNSDLVYNGVCNLSQVLFRKSSHLVLDNMEAALS